MTGGKSVVVDCRLPCEQVDISVGTALCLLCRGLPDNISTSAEVSVYQFFRILVGIYCLKIFQVLLEFLGAEPGLQTLLDLIH